MPELIPLVDVAKRLGIHENTLRKAVNLGELEAYDIGGFRFTQEAVDRYLEKKRVVRPKLAEQV